jgi:hypothetical protein
MERLIERKSYYKNMSWEDFINEETIEWLLGPEDPSIRFWTLQQFYQSDVLDILTALGVKDDRMQESIDLVLNSRNTQSTWDLKNTYNGKMYCEIEEKHKPSKWITLRALRVLRRYYS